MTMTRSQDRSLTSLWAGTYRFNLNDRRGVGGRAGGLARTISLSPEKRREIAKAAAAARWRGGKEARDGDAEHSACRHETESAESIG